MLLRHLPIKLFGNCRLAAYHPEGYPGPIQETTLTIQQDPTSSLRRWAETFESALAANRPGGVAELFVDDGHWRDVLAFTWTFATFRGAKQIGDEMQRLAAGLRPREFQINPDYPVKRKVWIGHDVLEGMLDFQTKLGRCSAVVRLVEDNAGQAKAWVVISHLDELSGFEERIGDRRPRNTPSLSTIGGENWLDQRLKTIAFEDREPAVMIVGGGQAGIALAARLNVLGVDTLVVDRMARAGDNWRNRYHPLTLHNEICVNDLPYMPFPQTWPQYIPKDKLGDWFEFYVSAMEINFWTSTEFEAATYDNAKGRWNATVRRDGRERVLHPRHIVLAAGLSGRPNIPKIDGLENFAGEVLHSSQYSDNAKFAGKNVMVVGTGNSGHDVAQDLFVTAASVTLVQKGRTMVINCEPTAQMGNAPYLAGVPVDLVDKAAMFNPYPLFIEAGKFLTAQFIEMDRELTEGLEAAGFRTNWGWEDNSGFLPLYYTRGGGYYFNVGCSNLIIDGKIRVVQFDDIADFDAKGPVLAGGEAVPVDAIILATGYGDLQSLVRDKFGDKVADAVGPVWGFDEGKELSNMWRRTAQPGLWFHAGSIPQARCMSKPLALQIKAVEEGLLAARLEIREAVSIPVVFPVETALHVASLVAPRSPQLCSQSFMSISFCTESSGSDADCTQSTP